MARCPKCSVRFQLLESENRPPEKSQGNNVNPVKVESPPSERRNPAKSEARRPSVDRHLAIPEPVALEPGAPESEGAAAIPPGLIPKEKRSRSAAVSRTIGSVPSKPEFPAVSEGPELPDGPLFVTTTSENSGILQQVSARRKRRSTTQLLIPIFGLAAVLIIVIAILYPRNNVHTDAGSSNFSAPVVTGQRDPQPKINSADSESADGTAVTKARSSPDDKPSTPSPTAGPPISLDLIPFSPQLVLHLRSADLWQNSEVFRELQSSLGVLGIWLGTEIQSIAAYSPEEISELTIAVNFGPRNSQPDVGAVVRLVKQQPQSEFQQRIRGRRRVDLQADIYESETHSILQIDQTTFAVAPLAMSDALADSAQHPAVVSAELETLLAASDRSRHLTLMFEIKALDVHRDTILPQGLQSLADEFLRRFEKDAGGISWSIHLQPHFYMETLFRCANNSSSQRVRRRIEEQLARLPEDMSTHVRTLVMKARGEQKLVGRFPAMLKALELGTVTDTAPQQVRLISLLPAQAAASLSAGSLITWRRSVQDSQPSPPRETSDVPGLIVDRLKKPVLADFRNQPLQEVFDFLGSEIQTKITINGDALKSAGFTQNMAQTMSLGTVPAISAIDAILQQYAGERDPMVICIDQNGQRIIVTTKSAAVQLELPIHESAAGK